MKRLIRKEAEVESIEQSRPKSSAPKKRRGRPPKKRVEPNFTILGHGDTLIKLEMPESSFPAQHKVSMSEAQDGLNRSKQSNNTKQKLEGKGELKRIYLCERGSCGKV